MNRFNKGVAIFLLLPALPVIAPAVLASIGLDRVISAHAPNWVDHHLSPLWSPPIVALPIIGGFMWLLVHLGVAA